MFKHYGLTGQTISVKAKHGESAECPWGYDEQKMRVNMETAYFLLLTVLPHRHPMGFGLSRPYRTTIHKHDIQVGDFIINGGAIR